MTVVRYCLCGAAMRARSMPAAAAEYLSEQFDQRHAGEGHGPATPAVAARARRREERAADEQWTWICGRCGYMNTGGICAHCGQLHVPQQAATEMPENT